jgi:hypothetical protein
VLLGLDFDNTIVCYDRLFHALAVERGLMSRESPATKQAVRDHLRATNREQDWTELQAIAYGPRIIHAEPWPGVSAFLQSCREANVRVAIISHKTRYPYRGEKFDLHAAAHTFLDAYGLYKTSDTGLSPTSVFLELTLHQKLERICSLGCDAFIDDLPEVLTEPAFPSGIRKVLFDPADVHHDHTSYTRATSWEACSEMLLAAGKGTA